MRLVTDAPTHRRVVLERRRRTFTRLVVAATVMLAIAVIFRGWSWLLFLGTLGALGVYVALLLSWKAQARQAAAVVRTFPDRSGHAAEEPADVRITASGDAVFAEPEPQFATAGSGAWEPHPGVRIRRWDG